MLKRLAIQDRPSIQTVDGLPESANRLKHSLQVRNQLDT